MYFRWSKIGLRLVNYSIYNEDGKKKYKFNRKEQCLSLIWLVPSTDLSTIENRGAGRNIMAKLGTKVDVLSKLFMQLKK